MTGSVVQPPSKSSMFGGFGTHQKEATPERVPMMFLSGHVPPKLDIEQAALTAEVGGRTPLGIDETLQPIERKLLPTNCRLSSTHSIS